MVARYDKDVMICEVGMSWDEAEVCKEFLVKLLKHSKTIDRCLGIFIGNLSHMVAGRGILKELLIIQENQQRLWMLLTMIIYKIMKKEYLRGYWCG